MRARALVVFGLCGVLAALPPAFAQSPPASRSEEIAAAERAKAAVLSAPEPTPVERVVRIARRLGLLEPPSGLYAWLGSVTQGGGLAAGPAARWPYSDTGVLSAMAARSIRGYTTAAAHIRLPDAARGRIRGDLAARWLDAPQVPFYGLGPRSSRSDRTLFRYSLVEAGGEIELRPLRVLALRGGLGLVTTESGPGRGRAPSVGERFGPGEAP
ncbi:MAG TPA: hypothetical protein VNK92_02630, partial [Vicinamibacterales bacterium]|nr:hypothetical protein [Vicinamibacterales bacterium]